MESRPQVVEYVAVETDHVQGLYDTGTNTGLEGDYVANPPQPDNTQQHETTPQRRRGKQQFACKWNGCSAPAFDSMSTLGDHLSIVHIKTQKGVRGKRKNAKGFICEWDGCRTNKPFHGVREVQSHIRAKHTNLRRGKKRGHRIAKTKKAKITPPTSNVTPTPSTDILDCQPPTVITQPPKKRHKINHLQAKSPPEDSRKRKLESETSHAMSDENSEPPSSAKGSSAFKANTGNATPASSLPPSVARSFTAESTSPPSHSSLPSSYLSPKSTGHSPPSSMSHGDGQRFTIAEPLKKRFLMRHDNSMRISRDVSLLVDGPSSSLPMPVPPLTQ